MQDADVDREELFGQNGDLVENVKEDKKYEEQERFLEEDDPEDLEGVTEEPPKKTAQDN